MVVALKQGVVYGKGTSEESAEGMDARRRHPCRGVRGMNATRRRYRVAQPPVIRGEASSFRKIMGPHS